VLQTFAILLSLSAAPERVVVLDFKGDVSPSEKQLIGDLIATKIDKLGLDVLTAADVREAVNLQAQSETLGCEADSSCLAEVASAMGAKYVVFGSIGRLGKNFVINVNLFDQSNAHSAARETIRAENLDVLPEKIDAGVTALVANIAPAQAPPPATPEPAMNPMMLVGGGALGVGGLATLVFGIGTVLFDGAAGEATTRSDFDGAQSAGILCLAGTGVGAAVAATGGVILAMTLAE
jgi:hypothetical protein